MKKYILLFAAAVLGASCSNLLDQDPTDKYTPEQLAKVDLDILVAPLMSAANLKMHTMGAGTQYRSYKCLNLNLDLLGNDMIVANSGAGWFTNTYSMQNYRGITDNLPTQLWSQLYTLVYSSNQVMDFIDFDLAKDTKYAKFIMAQALTLRAFAYYNLICLFQDAYLHGGNAPDAAGVPLYLKLGTGALARGKATDVYSQIITDCNDAIKYFDEARMMPGSNEGISIYVTYMVLARTALTMGEFSTAATAADVVINGYALMDETEALDNGFQKIDGTETIWGYKWTQNTTIQNNNFASHMSSTALGYGGSGGGYKIMDERLYNQIPAQDWRKKLYYSVATDIEYDNGTSTVVQKAPQYTNAKFNSLSYNLDEIYMRAAEAYFIKAEAQAANTPADYPGAQQTLYNILSTRISGYTKSTKTGNDLLDEIRLHKRIEMWGEGLEFFDNKRIGKGVDRMSSTNQTVKVVVPAGKDFTLRLPQSEIERNPNISADQNNKL